MSRELSSEGGAARYFYSGDCPHCLRFIPEWREFGGELASCPYCATHVRVSDLERVKDNDDDYDADADHWIEKAQQEYLRGKKDFRSSIVSLIKARAEGWASEAGRGQTDYARGCREKVHLLRELAKQIGEMNQ